jgi:acyl dehydratase
VLPSQGLADLSTLVIRPDGNHGLQGRTRIRLPDASTFFAPGSPTRESPIPDFVSFKGLRTGQRAETRRTFTARDLAEYASLAGDTNPIYTDGAQARGFGLDGLLVPGGLLGGLFSFLLGTRLPGRGTNYLKQRLEFAAPAYAGQSLVASVEIERIRPEKQLVNLRTQCKDRSGQTVCQGEALVLARDVQSEL